VLERIRQAGRKGVLERGDPESLLPQALGAGVINAAEEAAVRVAAEARRAAIEVDSFSPEDYFPSTEAELEVGALTR
jgi:hypothetical protein